MITIVLADQQHLRSGVSGYVGTPARGSELVRAIRKVAAGGGHSSANIASRLSISHRTAESHRANVMRKLHLGNQIDLVRFAIAYGIVAVPVDPLRHWERAPRRRAS